LEETAASGVAKVDHSIERVLGIIPLIRQCRSVHKSLVDRVPQLAGAEPVKVDNKVAFKPVSFRVRQIRYNDALKDGGAGADRFDQLAMHPRR